MRKSIISFSLLLIPVALCAWNNTSSPYTFSGKVGIGKSDPSHKLEVIGDVRIASSDFPMLIIDASYNGKSPQMRLYDSNDNHWSFLYHTVDNNLLKIRWNSIELLNISTSGDLILSSSSIYFEDQHIFGDNDDDFVLKSNNSSDANLLLNNANGDLLGGISGNSVTGVTQILDSNNNPAIEVQAGGAVTITRIPPQGDVLMGDFTE